MVDEFGSAGAAWRADPIKHILIKAAESLAAALASEHITWPQLAHVWHVTSRHGPEGLVHTVRDTSAAALFADATVFVVHLRGHFWSGVVVHSAAR